MSRLPLLPSLVLTMLLSLSAAAIDPRYDAPGGHYSAGGNYRHLNPADLGPKGPSATDLRNAANYHHPAKQVGESIGDHEIRKARIPVEVVAPLAEEYSPAADPKNMTGKVGWGDKLTGAESSANLGADVAFVTTMNLLQPWVRTLVDGTVGGDPAALAASQQIMGEMRRQMITSSIFGEFQERYGKGARVLALNYEAPQGNDALTKAVADAKNPPKNDGTVNPGSRAYDPNDIVAKLDPDDVKALDKAGIDVTEIIAGVLSGTFDENAFNAAHPPKAPPTAEQLAAGKQLADDALKTAGLAPRGDGADDGAEPKARATAKRDATPGKSLSFFAPGTPKRVPPPRRLARSRRSGGGDDVDEDDDVTKKKKMNRDALKALLASLIKRRQEVLDQGASLHYELLGQGVQSPRHAQNIFHIAHRNYRSFQKWRQGQEPLTRMVSTDPLPQWH